MTKKRERFEAKQKNKNPIFILAASGFMVLVVVLSLWWNNRTEEPAEVIQQATPLALHGNEWALGNPEAKVVIIEYGDYQCGACAYFHPMVKDIVRLYGEQIYFVYRHFPLIQIHRHAQMAATVSEAAGNQGKFWEMHDLIYTRQQTWSRGNAQLDFTRYASELNLDMEQFQADVRSDEVFKRVERDFNSAMQLQINSVPSFYVNGVRISNPQTITDFRRIIDEKLK